MEFSELVIARLDLFLWVSLILFLLIFLIFVDDTSNTLLLRRWTTRMVLEDVDTSTYSEATLMLITSHSLQWYLCY